MEQAIASADLLTVRNLSVTLRGDPAIDLVKDVSFSVAAGETLCIVGESGCGKSLTSLALMGLLPPNMKASADTSAFDGLDLMSASQRQLARMRGNDMAMIFQNPMSSLNPVYTLGNQMVELARLHGAMSRAEARDRALYLLDRVGIAAGRQRLGQYPHELSGGQRQRAMIAMMLMCGPRLLIADEPTTALDVTIQTQILQLLAELQDEMQLALILITHDLGIVARVADRVAVMYAGQVAETGRCDEIFAQPIHPYTRGLLECLPTMDADLKPARLGTIPGTVPAPGHAFRQCTFFNRCSMRLPACQEGPVPQVEVGPGRLSRCLRSMELAESDTAGPPAPAAAAHP